MPHYEAKRDCYSRGLTSSDAKAAAEEFAAWYCGHNAEWDDTDLVVSVREKFAGFGPWKDFKIEIETVPHFHATPTDT